MVKNRTIEEAQEIRNTEIARELELPPQKIHCSVLAEDAIRAAIADYRKKRTSDLQRLSWSAQICAPRPVIVCSVVLSMMTPTLSINMLPLCSPSNWRSHGHHDDR